jgi:molybdopterin-guanine dinucleotide biosynthesis protein A
MKQVAGIILAGGQSRRMGTNKALLPLPGPGNEHRTFVAHLAQTLAARCSETVLVVRDQAAATEYVTVPVGRIVCDRIPDHGPLMGLYSGLSEVHATHALAIAVDMPFLQPAMLAFLLSQPLTGAILVPVVNGIPQVLCAVYPRSILPLIEARLSQGRRDPRSLLDIATVTYIDESKLRAIDPQLRSFININTPEELQGCESLTRGA